MRGALNGCCGKVGFIVGVGVVDSVGRSSFVGLMQFGLLVGFCVGSAGGKS